jgi:hypothetical protein
MSSGVGEYPAAAAAVSAVNWPGDFAGAELWRIDRE